MSSLIYSPLQEEATYGDGYEGKTQPHTPYEKFEGITVKDAVEVSIVTIHIFQKFLE